MVFRFEQISEFEHFLIEINFEFEQISNETDFEFEQFLDLNRF
jgi:hypothetical protein